jgi:hypothetical protein
MRLSVLLRPWSQRENLSLTGRVAHYEISLSIQAGCQRSRRWIGKDADVRTRVCSDSLADYPDEPPS